MLIEIFSIMSLDSQVKYLQKGIDFDNFLTKIERQDHSEYHFEDFI